MAKPISLSPTKLSELWEKYREDKKSELAPTTYRVEYGKVTRRIEQIPKETRTGKAYRSYLLKTYSVETAKRTLRYINACCTWAVNENLLSTNPFASVKIRVPKTAPSDPAAFSADEMVAIFNRFSIVSPHYLAWTKALFWLAARPEELRALRWKHLAGDGQTLLINEAWPIEAARPQTTKTRRSTRFPLNERLQTLFHSIKPLPCAPTDWIFKSIEGEAFNYANYQRRHWKPLVEQLVEEGKVSYYGSQYHARHTGITLMLRSGLDVEDVAYLTRTSRKVIFENYLARSRKIEVPEF